jgi:hypothetical protein
MFRLIDPYSGDAINKLFTPELQLYMDPYITLISVLQKEMKKCDVILSHFLITFTCTDYTAVFL